MTAVTDMTPREVSMTGLPHQAELWGNDTNGAEIALVCPLGQGKTFALALKGALLQNANPGLDGMLVVPTYDIFRQIHRQEFPEIWGKIGLPSFWFATDGYWRFPSGGKLWVRSADTPERLVGSNLAYVLGDEPGLWQKLAYQKATSRVRHPKADLLQTVVAGTPEGLNWFADLFDNPDGKRITIRGRGWHPDMAHYPEKLKDTYGHDPALLAAYVKGEFVPLRSGRAYVSFTRSKHVKDCKVDQALPLTLACDFNVDTMRWLVMQFHREWVHVVDEIALGSNGTTERAALEFVQKYATHRAGVVVNGDAAGKARSTAGKTDYQVIREVVGRRFTNFNISHPAANPLVKDRVDLVNYHLAGRGKTVTVDPRCKHLIRDFERVQWSQGARVDLDKKDHLLTHATDAFGYAIWQQARRLQLVKQPKAPEGPGEYMDHILNETF